MLGLMLSELQQLSVGSCLLLRGLWLCIPAFWNIRRPHYKATDLQCGKPSCPRFYFEMVGVCVGIHSGSGSMHGTHGIKPTTLNSSPCLTCPDLKEHSLAVTRTANTAQLGRKNTPASSVPVLHLLFGNGFSNASFLSDSSGC